MNLHEYQAKQLFLQYQLPISKGMVCENLAEIEQALMVLSSRCVAKCQIHAGGRGKAGGVKLINQPEDARAFAKQWLGQYLVTEQTGAQGQLVKRIYLEATAEIQREFYFAFVVDRCLQQIVVMASEAGGVDIEKVAENTPHLLHKMPIDLLTGAMAYQGRELAFKLGLVGDQVAQFVHIFLQSYRLFIEKDLSLLEINPLVLTTEGKLLYLDAKVSVDSNALYRQAELKAMQDPSQDDVREMQAEQHQLNYVALDGNIACMVNGAGLAMGTMDMVKLYGGQPANFLDVGGGATKQRVTEAFKIILSDEKVKVILVNIFGGIVSCELIAEGIISAVQHVGVQVPVVVRLEGNKAESGRELLMQSGLNIIAAQSLTDATIQAVNAAKEQ